MKQCLNFLLLLKDIWRWEVAGKMAQQLSALAIFLEDPDLIPSIHMAAHCMFQESQCSPVAFLGTRHTYGTHTNIHSGKMLIHIKKNSKKIFWGLERWLSGYSACRAYMRIKVQTPNTDVKK